MKLTCLLLLVIAAHSAGCARRHQPTGGQVLPKAVQVSDLASLNGIYEVRSRDPKTGEPYNGVSLFSFLSRRDSLHHERGAYVEIRAAPKGKSLNVRLLDQNYMPLEEAALVEGGDFDFSARGLKLRGAQLGPGAEASNLAAWIEHKSRRLTLGETGALLGQNVSREAGMLFYMIPFAGVSGDRMLWLRQAGEAKSTHSE